VPVLNGFNHDEELIFTAALGTAVSGGTFVDVPVSRPVTPAGYLPDIAAVIGVPNAQAAAIAAQYPLAAYPNADVAFETLVSDANFACPALQVDRWTAQRTPTFAYEFDDTNAPGLFAPFPAATHSSELQYLFGQPNDPNPGGLSADQQALAASMRAAWASFAAGGDPSRAALRWPAFTGGERVMSLVPPQPHVATGSAAAHHCTFWEETAR
jgi:para-nitrobenzyl esterase